jgi:hypothetical protein
VAITSSSDERQKDGHGLLARDSSTGMPIILVLQITLPFRDQHNRKWLTRTLNWAFGSALVGIKKK